MKYSYQCDSCKTKFDVYKGSMTSGQPEPCPECLKASDRYYGDAGSVFVDYNIGKYDPQLGLVVESSDHRRRIMKERGLEAVDGSFDYVGHVTRKKEEATKERDTRFRSKLDKKITEANVISV